MGIMSFSINGSDMAADFVAGPLAKAMAAAMKDELSNPGNEYNTSGAQNVAMVFDEIINKHSVLRNCSVFVPVAIDVHNALVIASKSSQCDYNSEYWSFMHNMIKSVASYMEQTATKYQIAQLMVVQAD